MRIFYKETLQFQEKNLKITKIGVNLNSSSQNYHSLQTNIKLSIHKHCCYIYLGGENARKVRRLNKFVLGSYKAPNVIGC